MGDERSDVHSRKAETRLTPSTVVEEIVRNDPTGTLCTDDVIVHFKNVHHGKGIKNPNDYVYFFEKQRPWEGPTSAKPAPDNLARTIDSRKYNLPESLERDSRVLQENDMQDTLNECLRMWSKTNACPSPRGAAKARDVVKCSHERRTYRYGTSHM